MKKTFIVFALMAMLVVGSFNGSVVRTTQAQSGEHIVTQCDSTRAACRVSANGQFAICRVLGGSYLVCWLESENNYSLCVLNSGCMLGGD